MKDHRLPTEFDYRYFVDSYFGGWRHSYVVHGRDGAVEFSVSEFGTGARETSAGLEMHSTIATKDRPPDHSFCRAAGWRPCWHDGTSLYAEEQILPLWRETRGDRIVMFERLVSEYRRRFSQEAGNGGEVTP